MASVPEREFRNADTLDRVLARHQNRGFKYGNPLDILIAIETEAMERYASELPEVRSVSVRNYINIRLHNITR